MDIDGEIASNPKPRVSVIILTYNGIRLLRLCLPSVLASKYSNLEIIVADNASSDGSAEWLASTHPSVLVVRHPSNLLFCAGNNRAVDHASGEYIVLLNNDVEVEPSWLEPLIDCMEADAAVGAVQPKLLQYQDRSKFEYAGGAGGHIDRYGYPFTRGRMFFEMEVDSGQYDHDMDIFWATGAALCTRKAVFQKLGGFDERFEMHMEEIDLCWRMQRKGLSIRAVSASRAYHIGGASLPHGSSRKTYLNYRNNILTLYKNLSPSDWLKTFPVRVLLDGIGIVRFVLLLKFGEAFAVFRAYGAAHFMKRTMKNERPKAGEQTVLPHYRRSVVLDYFVYGHRHFSALRTEGFHRPERKSLPKSID
jgi:GT2 family glycosyltransferase